MGRPAHAASRTPSSGADSTPPPRAVLAHLEAQDVATVVVGRPVARMDGGVDAVDARAPGRRKESPGGPRPLRPAPPARSRPSRVFEPKTGAPATVLMAKPNTKSESGSPGPHLHLEDGATTRTRGARQAGPPLRRAERPRRPPRPSRRGAKARARLDASRRCLPRAAPRSPGSGRPSPPAGRRTRRARGRARWPGGSAPPRATGRATRRRASCRRARTPRTSRGSGAKRPRRRRRGPRRRAARPDRCAPRSRSPGGRPSPTSRSSRVRPGTPRRSANRTIASKRAAISRLRQARAAAR